MRGWFYVVAEISYQKAAFRRVHCRGNWAFSVTLSEESGRGSVRSWPPLLVGHCKRSALVSSMNSVHRAFFSQRTNRDIGSFRSPVSENS
jgi:hypothetical protein